MDPHIPTASLSDTNTVPGAHTVIHADNTHPPTFTHGSCRASLILPCQLGETQGRVSPLPPAAPSTPTAQPGARVWTRVQYRVPRSRGPKCRQRPQGLEPRGAAKSPRERGAAPAQLLRGAARRGPSGEHRPPSPSARGTAKFGRRAPPPPRLWGPRPASARPPAALTDVDDGVGPHRHALAYPGEKPQRQRFHVPRARGSSARARGEAEGSAERGGAGPGAVPGRSPGEPSPPVRLLPRARPCALRPPQPSPAQRGRAPAPALVVAAAALAARAEAGEAGAARGGSGSASRGSGGFGGGGGGGGGGRAGAAAPGSLCV